MIKTRTIDKVPIHVLKTIVDNLDRNELNSQCERWAFIHGFVQRCLTADDMNVIPYPFTIYPSPYPRCEYERAYKTQYAVNRLIQNLASSIDLMDSIIDNLVECDPFIRRLRRIYDKVHNSQHKSTVETCIIRTDYMLEQAKTFNECTRLRLVEINTIAVGLGAAAKLIHDWHEQFLKRIQPELLSQLPDNESYNLVIDTLYQSWKIYNNPKAIILFVIPDQEFNIGDQMLTEKGLLHENPCLLIKHVTFTDICRQCSIDFNGFLFFGKYEVALVYYRTAYDPKHFYNEDIWTTYVMLECSRAIKCPSLRYHLAGMKCFQIMFNDRNFLKSVFQDHEQYIDDFRDVLEEVYTIDQIINDPELKQRMINRPESFYLKQSREGGGNVYCGPLLKERIDNIIVTKQSNRYFLMSRIYSPISASLIRSSKPNDRNEFIYEKEINSELGMFGSLISQNGAIIYQRIGGSLLRSKPVTSIEGGIASGQGCIDSLLLV